MHDKQIKPNKKIDLTNRIIALFHSSARSEICTKIILLLSLMLKQTDDVKKQMVKQYVANEFSFLFSKNDRDRSPEYVNEVKRILREALLEEFDEDELGSLFLGFTSRFNPGKETLILLKSHRLFLYHELPAEKTIPNTMKMINQLKHHQEAFKVLAGYRIRDDFELLSGMLPRPSNRVNNNIIIQSYLCLIVSALLVFAVEAYIIQNLVYSELEEKNNAVFPISALMMVANLLMLAMARQVVVSISPIRRQLVTTLKTTAESFMQGKLPEMIVIEVNGQKKQSLPLFEPKPANLPLAYFEGSVKQSAVPQTETSIKRLPFVKRLTRYVENDESLAAPKKKPGDVIKVDGVVYRQLYNRENIPTSQYVGYTNDVLMKLTSPGNITTFKNLLDHPSCVSPKANNGFVLSHSSSAPFKLKSARENLRLLFSTAVPAKLDGKPISLFQLADSKSHNKMKR